MAPFKRSIVLLNYSSDEDKTVKVKKCVCLTNPNHCFCHPIATHMEGDNSYKRKDERKCFKETKSPSSHGSLNRDISSKFTVKELNKHQNEVEISLPCLSTMTFPIVDDGEREEAYKNWCVKKDQERKLREEEMLLIQKLKQKEKELQLQLERESFRRWVIRKKKEEESRKREKEKEEEIDKLRQEMKEKRIQENALNYQLWLKQKEEMLLERKIQEQRDLLRREQEKQIRIQESMRAYEEWLVNSKTRPKPIPVASLGIRGSMSIMPDFELMAKTCVSIMENVSDGQRREYRDVHVP